MSPSAFFNRLQAPLLNVQWSWGAVRPDGIVILRVWGDQTQPIDGKRFVRLTHHSIFRGIANNGYNERIRHVAAIQAGADAYAVMCNAVDDLAEPREIRSFDDRTLIHLGELLEIDGDEWAEMKARISLKEFQTRSSPLPSG